MLIKPHFKSKLLPSIITPGAYNLRKNKKNLQSTQPTSKPKHAFLSKELVLCKGVHLYNTYYIQL